MNRPLKKAVSFITAMAVSISVLASASVSASAASAVSAKQVVKNSNELALSFANGAFFASKTVTETMETTNRWGELVTTDVTIPADNAKFYMVTSNGKKVTVKNSIGFDKIYSVTTGGVPFNPYNDYTKLAVNDRSAVAVGKGDKYAAILANGKFLANGKLFDSINIGYDYITGIDGKYTYIYNSDSGKQMTKIKSTSIGVCSEYDKSSKTYITFSNTSIEGGWGYDYHLVKGGKIVKSFMSDKYNSLYFVKNGNKNIVCAKTKDWPANYEYYTTSGKTTTFKTNSASKNDYYLTYNYDSNWETGITHFTVTDSNGKEILAYDTKVYPPEKGDPQVIINNGKMIIAYDIFCIIDTATGKIETKTKAKGYCGISTISSSNSSFVLDVRDNDSYWYKKVLVSSKGKELSAVYNGIAPVEYDGVIGTDFYTYNKSVAFTMNDDNDKCGLISNKGKVLLKPSYDFAAARYKTAVLMCKNSTYDIINCANGKALKKGLFIPNYVSFIHTSAKSTYLITCTESKDKFGCVVIKS